jgi:hypothetical protein
MLNYVVPLIYLRAHFPRAADGRVAKVQRSKEVSTALAEHPHVVPALSEPIEVMSDQ